MLLDAIFFTKHSSIEDMDLSRIHKAEIYKALLVDLTESLPYLNENTEQEHMFVSQDLANALIAAIHLENETEALFTRTYRENYNDANYDFSSFLKKGNFHPIYRNISIQLNYSETLLALNKTSELLTVELLDIQPYELLYPIPIRELHANQYMTQNPGY